MGSHNIAVRDDVYDMLRRDRGPGESFTKVLLRLLHQKGGLHELSGAWGTASPRSELVRWRELRGTRGRSR